MTFGSLSAVVIKWSLDYIGWSGGDLAWRESLSNVFLFESCDVKTPALSTDPLQSILSVPLLLSEIF